MPVIALSKRKNPLPFRVRNEAVVLLSSAAGRTIGFIVEIGRHGIPFDNTTGAKFTNKENMLDTLMDGSFLPVDTEADNEIEDMEFSDNFNNIENKFRRRLQFKELTGKHQFDLEYFLQHIHMTEN